MMKALIIPFLFLGCASNEYKLPPKTVKVIKKPNNFSIDKTINFSVMVTLDKYKGTLKDVAESKRLNTVKNLATSGFLYVLNLPHLYMTPHISGRTFSMNSFTRNDRALGPCSLKNEIKNGDGFQQFYKIKEYCTNQGSHRETRYSNYQNYYEDISKAHRLEVLEGSAPLEIIKKKNTYRLADQFVHHEFGVKQSDGKFKKRAFEFRPLRGTDSNQIIFWRAPDYEDIYKRKKIQGAEVGLEYTTMLKSSNDSSIYLPNFDFINFFDTNVPMISPDDYTMLLDKISNEMSLYGIEDYLNNADYNGFSYYVWKSYIFSDDASGNIKFKTPHHRAVRQPQTLRTIWSILLLANTKTEMKVLKNNIIQISFEVDLPAAVKQSKLKPLSDFYE